MPQAGDLVASVDAAASDELERVGAAVALADELGSLGDEVVDHFIAAARRAGCSWSQIGGQLGVTKQAAQQAFAGPAPRRGRSGRRRQRWSDEAGLVLKGAGEESRALGHAHIGTEHLLLALVAGGGSAGEALRRLGVDHDTVRGHVVDIIGLCDATGSGRLPFTPPDREDPRAGRPRVDQPPP